MPLAAAGLHSPRPRQGRTPLHRPRRRTAGGTMVFILDHFPVRIYGVN